MSVNNILDNMAKDSALGDDKRLLRAQFYGDPGAGKSTLALLTAMELGEKVLFLTTDSGWSVLHKYPEYRDRVHRIPFAGLSQVDAIVDAHTANYGIYGSFDTLVWDTVSGSVDLFLRNLTDAKKNNPSFAKQQVDPLVEGWPHYRIAGRTLTDTVEKFEKSNLNVIYISHIKDPSESDKEKKRFAIRPDMPESCFKVVHRHVNMLGFMYREKKGSDRLIQLEGTLHETAKSQISTIPETTYKATDIPKLIREWRDQ